MKLSVITVSYNNESTIGEYLEDVKKNLPDDSEIIVVDNASSDKTVEVLKKDKTIKLLLNPRNLGFGQANNQAVKIALGEYLFFLNPDTRVQGEAIKKLLNYIQENSQVGIVAPKLILSTGCVQRSVRNFPTIWGAFKESLLGSKGAYDFYEINGGKPVEVESVVGAAMMISKRLLELVGGFDSRYFMYFEDLQLCKDIKKLSKKIVYLPEAEVIHVVGVSTKSNPKTLELIKESAEIYHGKLGSKIHYLVIRGINFLARKLRPKAALMNNPIQ